MRGLFAFLLCVGMTVCASRAVQAASLTDDQMLPVAFDRADAMWQQAHDQIAASVRCLSGQTTDCLPQQSWQDVQALIARAHSASLATKLDLVNRWANDQPYVSDTRNWGRPDHWAQVADFLQAGGDCEDYAIAKYALLRALGVPAEQMLIVIADDLQKRQVHAFLVVRARRDARVLDNQATDVQRLTSLGRYLPRVAINENGLWRMASEPLVMAAAARR